MIYQGVIAPASPGVLEAVAHRRAAYWQQIPVDWHEYDVLIALPDCDLLGRRGWLAVGEKIHTALVVDCEQQAHRGTMNRNGLMADANMERGEGMLVLR